MKTVSIPVVLALAALALPAAAEQPKLLGTFEMWDAFSVGSGNAKACYAITVPQHVKPATVEHGAVYLMVSQKPGKKVRDEVRVGFGYPLKANSDVRAIVGGFNEVLFTAGNDAWAYDAKADARVVAAMKGGRMLTAKAVSARGTLTEYDFPLAGFTKAYVAASNACGV